jgi:UDP-N-acetylmuramate--alanine ligase
MQVFPSTRSILCRATGMSAATIDLNAVRRAHLVGIGGMHMSAIAAVLLARGIAVSGSDVQLSPYTERLARQGATIHLGHDAANLGDADLVVATVALKDDNPEIAAARARGLPVLIRAEMVAALMQQKMAVCIAGTHGKTTTSSLVAYGLVVAGRQPSYLLGADALDLGGNAAPGAGAEIVVEADEYSDAFLHYAPDLALITNVDTDHLDYFGTDAAIDRSFAAFVARVRPGGTIIGCLDSPRLRALLRPGDGASPNAAAAIEGYALDAENVAAAEWAATIESTAPEHRFSVTYRGRPFGGFVTLLPGRHNVADCLGAIAALHPLGVPLAAMQRAVATFRGAKRRFELLGERNGVLVVDDYAHNAAKVAAALAAAREKYPQRRLIAVFQPHTYSRTAYLLDRFRDAFAAADMLLLLPTYAARETPAAGLDATALARAITTPRPVALESYDDAIGWLAAHSRAGDLLLTLGAGPIDAVARGFLDREAQR